MGLLPPMVPGQPRVGVLCIVPAMAPGQPQQPSHRSAGQCRAGLSDAGGHAGGSRSPQWRSHPTPVLKAAHWPGEGNEGAVAAWVGPVRPCQQRLHAGLHPSQVGHHAGLGVLCREGREGGRGQGSHGASTGWEPGFCAELGGSRPPGSGRRPPAWVQLHLSPAVRHTTINPSHPPGSIRSRIRQTCTSRGRVPPPGWRRR